MGRKISQKTLIALRKWKMLLQTLSEGETILQLDERKQCESLRYTIYRTNRDRKDKEYIYDGIYRDKIFVVTKERRTNNEGEHSESC